MANNRYYLWCPCGSKQFLGKSLGDGIYQTRGGAQSFSLRQHDGVAVLTPEQAPAETRNDGQARFLDDVYEWMWKHLMGRACYDKRVELGWHEPEVGLDTEWVKGEVFKVLTEYDDRV